LWQEIDLFYEITWEYSGDGGKYDKTVEKEKVFDFLHGLNSNLDEVRGILLRKNPFPSMRKAFAEVRREESIKKMMLPASRPLDNEVCTQTSTLNTSRVKSLNTSRRESQKDKQ